MVKCSEDDLDKLFFALSDPNRRHVVTALLDGEKALGDLAPPFNMTIPAVMKHIAVLENSGIVKTEKRGRVRYCRLEPDRLEVAQEWLADTTRMWTDRLRALSRYLEENP